MKAEEVRAIKENIIKSKLPDHVFRFYPFVKLSYSYITFTKINETVYQRKVVSNIV